MLCVGASEIHIVVESKALFEDMLILNLCQSCVVRSQIFVETSFGMENSTK